MKNEQLVGGGAATLVAAAFVAACSGGGAGARVPAKPEQPAGNVTGYSIKAHVDVAGHPEISGWVEVPPLDANSWTKSGAFNGSKGVAPVAATSSSPGTRPQGSAAPPRHVLTTIGQGTDGGIDTELVDQLQNNAPGWELLYWATVACFNSSDPQHSLLGLDGMNISDHPWVRQANGSRNYYVFGHAEGSAGGGADFDPDQRSCDTRLGMQETLLCAADHLAQLADSPGTVTWSGTNGFDNKAITVTIPPQRSKDVFIARDMAINALAHLARLDTEWRTPTDPSSCIVQYSNAAAGAYNPGDNLFASGGLSEYFDPVPLPVSPGPQDFAAAARRRLTRKANVLVSAARLTRELVEHSVQDDISGAQQQLSSSTDYHQGARLAWGVDSDANPYNTLRHALRTVFGRLEIGNGASPDSPSGHPFVDPNSTTDWSPHDITRDDPKCDVGYDQGENILFPVFGSGVGALDEVKSIPGLSARWDDAPAKTPGEKLALSMLEHEGVVFPPALIDSSPPFSAINSLLLDDAAKLAGADTTTGFLVTESGRAFNTMVQGISQAEMSFAIARVYDAFRLLTQTEPETATEAATAFSDLNQVAVTVQPLAPRGERAPRV